MHWFKFFDSSSNRHVYINLNTITDIHILKVDGEPVAHCYFIDGAETPVLIKGVDVSRLLNILNEWSL